MSSRLHNYPWLRIIDIALRSLLRTLITEKAHFRVKPGTSNYHLEKDLSKYVVSGDVSIQIYSPPPFLEVFNHHLIYLANTYIAYTLGQTLFYEICKY